MCHFCFRAGHGPGLELESPSLGSPQLQTSDKVSLITNIIQERCECGRPAFILICHQPGLPDGLSFLKVWHNTCAIWPTTPRKCDRLELDSKKGSGSVKVGSSPPTSVGLARRNSLSLSLSLSASQVQKGNPLEGRTSHKIY